MFDGNTRPIVVNIYTPGTIFGAFKILIGSFFFCTIDGNEGRALNLNIVACRAGDDAQQYSSQCCLRWTSIIDFIQCLLIFIAQTAIF